MRWQRRVSVVDAHAEGEVGRVITGGVLDVPGETMFDKKRYLETEDDSLRRFVLFEPRGGAAMSVNLLLPPCDPGADLGMIVMESTDYPPMSVSNAICVVTVALETGIVPMTEPETRLVLDTPAGLVPVRARCRGGKCESVSLDNVPSFLLHRDLEIKVPGVGTIAADIAYGGAFFALVDAGDFGLAMTPREARRMVELGEDIKSAANDAFAAVHPDNPEIRDVTFTLFGGPPEGAEGTRKVAVVVSPGRLDRTIAGCAQLVRPPRNNEAQNYVGQLTHAFVAPWARGHGLARGLALAIEKAARDAGLRVLNLDLRETQDAAIKLYESLGYQRWGTHPHYAWIDDRWVAGYFYHKDLTGNGARP